MATQDLINKNGKVFETGTLVDTGDKATFTVNLDDGTTKIYDLKKFENEDNKWHIEMGNGSVDDQGPFTISPVAGAGAGDAMDIEGGSRKKSKKSKSKKSKRKTKGGKKQSKSRKQRR